MTTDKHREAIGVLSFIVFMIDFDIENGHSDANDDSIMVHYSTGEQVAS